MQRTVYGFFILYTLGVFLAPVVGFASNIPTIRAEMVLAFTNAERYKIGLPLLQSNSELSKVAQRKMTDLFARQYFAHEAPTGETVSDLAKDAGYEYLVVGENLALGDFTSSKDVVDAWMKSPGHRKNILASGYSEIGIAAGRSYYDGRYTWVIVQSFGYPKSGCPQLEPELVAQANMFDQKLRIYKTVAEMREAQVEQKKGSLEERTARVESYNTAARLYNTTLSEYQGFVEKYNDKVEAYNACLSSVTTSME